MKSLLSKYLGVFLLMASLTVNAQTPTHASEILAQRGLGQVTQTEFTARADKIPTHIRQGVLRNKDRLQNVINTMLLRAQLAADARAAGYDQQTLVQDRMQLAADAELAEAWVQHYVELQPAGNYELLSREYYELNKQDIMSTPQIDVSHILVSTDDRSEEEARQLADSISQKIDENPAIFDGLVKIHSDDPDSKSNQGRFYKVKSGDMVKSFEDEAFSLLKGEISKPVKTQHGFHIIRLDEHYPAVVMSFDVVKTQLIESERKRHQDRIRDDYLNGLTSLDVEMTEEALEEMVRRQFGEDYRDPEAFDVQESG